MHSQQPACERRAQDIRNRNGRHEQRPGPRAVLMTKPVREVDEDAGEKARFRRAQEKPRAVKLRRRSNHRHQNGDESPGNQNARNPAPRAPALDNQRAGNFKQKISGKENPRAQAEYAVGKSQVAGHLQAGKTDVYAVEIRDEIQDEKKWQQTPRDARRARCPTSDKGGPESISPVACITIRGGGYISRTEVQFLEGGVRYNNMFWLRMIWQTSLHSRLMYNLR